jgi:hypothetical protein
MKKTLLCGFVALGTTAFATSNTYKVNLTMDSVVEGKTLKAGDYKITMENGNAVIKQGKNTIEVPARAETDATKISSTEVTYRDDNQVMEIRFGGTNTKIVFEGAAPMASGQ